LIDRSWYRYLYDLFTRSNAIILTPAQTVSSLAYVVADTDAALRFTDNDCVLTLPPRANGRVLLLSTVTANAVVSGENNVVPLGSTVAGSAILAATAGKFAMLQSDGTNWLTLQAN
jgi:hypothetical protein